ncbi:MAG: CPBP family intramembrane metalloprotease [Oligoflexia bacterium]|nr:CPBP family intramembrane metalloprotease [Oligoflexia bacterium]
MELRNIAIIFIKELRESFRDRSLLLTNFAVPFLIVAISFMFIPTVVKHKVDVIEKYVFNISFNWKENIEATKDTKVNDEKKNLLPFVYKLKNDERITILENNYFATEIKNGEIERLIDFEKEQSEESGQLRTLKYKKSYSNYSENLERLRQNISKKMKERQVDLLVYYKQDQGNLIINTFADHSSEKSWMAQNYFAQIVDSENKVVVKKMLKKIGKDDDFFEPYKVHRYRLGYIDLVNSSLSTYLVGMFVQFLLLLAMYYPTINATIGEKTKHTLRPLLLNPVGHVEILIGKYLNIALQGLIGLIPYLLIVILFYHLGKFNSSSVDGLQNLIVKILQPETIIMLFFSVVSVALLISAFSFFVTILARTQQQAQALLSVGMFLLIIPNFFILLFDIKLNNLNVFIPFLNFSLLVKAQIINSSSLLWEWLVIIVNLIYSLLILVPAIQIFNYQIVYSSGYLSLSQLISFKRVRLERIDPAISWIIFTIILVGSIIVTLINGAKKENILFAFFVNKMVLCFGVSLFLMWFYKLNYNSILNLENHNDRKRWMLLSIIIGISSAFFMIMLLEHPLYFLSANNSSFAIATKLIFFALLAAVAEEIAFRGIILKGLLSSYPKFFSVVVSSLMFAVVRLEVALFIPLFFWGTILSILAIKRGIGYSIVSHVCFNSLLTIVYHYNIKLSLV